MIDEKDIKDKLTSEEYSVLRGKGTEAPFSGKYVHTQDKGMYMCKVCGNPLFSSESKFESAEPGLAGWPAFDNPYDNQNVRVVPDDSGGMHRMEVVCARCGSHLGHVFDAHDSPNGKHYCINSVCLDLKKEE